MRHQKRTAAIGQRSSQWRRAHSRGAPVARMRAVTASLPLITAVLAAGQQWQAMPFAGGSYGLASAGPGSQTAYYGPPAPGYGQAPAGWPLAQYGAAPYGFGTGALPQMGYGVSQPQQLLQAMPPPQAVSNPAAQPPGARISQDKEKTKIDTPRASIAISPPVIPAQGSRFDAERFRSALLALIGSLDGGAGPSVQAPPQPAPQQAPQQSAPASSRAFDGETICFPRQSPIVQRFLSRVSASEVGDPERSRAVLCYRAADLRAAGVLA